MTASQIRDGRLGHCTLSFACRQRASVWPTCSCHQHYSRTTGVCQTSPCALAVQIRSCFCEVPQLESLGLASFFCLRRLVEKPEREVRASVKYRPKWRYE